MSEMFSYGGLSEDHLRELRDSLYGGQWDLMLADLRRREEKLIKRDDSVIDIVRGHIKMVRACMEKEGGQEDARELMNTAGNVRNDIASAAHTPNTELNSNKIYDWNKRPDPFITGLEPEEALSEQELKDRFIRIIDTLAEKHGSYIAVLLLFILSNEGIEPEENLRKIIDTHISGTKGEFEFMLERSEFYNSALQHCMQKSLEEINGQHAFSVEDIFYRLESYFERNPQLFAFWEKMSRTTNTFRKNLVNFIYKEAKIYLEEKNDLLKRFQKENDIMEPFSHIDNANDFLAAFLKLTPNVSQHFDNSVILSNKISQYLFGIIYEQLRGYYMCQQDEGSM